jgi:nicotinamidase-related amidase
MWRPYYQKWRDVTLDKLNPSMVELVPVLRDFVPPAIQLDRKTYSAFADGMLHASLQKQQISTLILTGSETDVCVLSTALAAVDHGYRTIMACDAMASSSDESHDALMNLYSKRFEVQIEVSHISEIIEAWKV